MTRFLKPACCIAALLAATAGMAQTPDTRAMQAAPPAETAAAPETRPPQLYAKNLPPLHPWMFRHDRQKADWLGIAYLGKTLREPINIIISDGYAASAEEAEARLVAACAKTPYKDRYGHSSDYLAYINGAMVPQFPNKKRRSFANKPFEENNNHGRIFGPVFYNGRYWFTGAFSREKVSLAPKPEHKYVSFNQARDDFAWQLDRKKQYLVKEFVSLGNTLLGSAAETSGDHDGIAVLLEAAY